jgi:hypothetical protein
MTATSPEIAIDEARQQTLRSGGYSIEHFSAARRHGRRCDTSVSNRSIRPGDFPMSDTALHTPPEVIMPFDQIEADDLEPFNPHPDRSARPNLGPTDAH